MICFDPVVLDCLDRPEVIAYYFIGYVLIDLTHWVACPTPENPGQMCPVYVYSSQMTQSLGPDPCVPWPDPDLGDVFVFDLHPSAPTFPNVVSVDHAGNSSEECSP
jgi:hypothetical protein